MGEHTRFGISQTMKSRTSAAFFLVFAAVVACGDALTLTESTSARSAALAWLGKHGGAPQGDELAELKAENPEAYGIVKALLTKRSLGLLDPKHPSASFSAAKAPQAD